MRPYNSGFSIARNPAIPFFAVPKRLDFPRARNGQRHANDDYDDREGKQSEKRELYDVADIHVMY